MKLTSLTGGGLLLGFSWFSAEGETPLLIKKVPSTATMGFNSYLSISTDGTVTIVSTNPELGQDKMTTFPMIGEGAPSSDWTK